MPIIQRDGLPVAYDCAGTGPCVVLTHSLGCDRSMFSRQVAALGLRHRVINIDLRGHGGSGDPLQPFSLYDLVDDVLAVLDAERVDSAVWIGLSMGGLLAMRAALRHPERVRALVLMNTMAGAETFLGTLELGALRWFLLTWGSGPLVSPQVRTVLGKTSLRERPDVRAQMTRMFRAARARSIAEVMRTLMHRDDVRRALGGIACPTLVITGAEDRALPIVHSQEIARRIPRAELVVLPRCGHQSALEVPEAVNQALLTFLNRLDLHPAQAA